MAPSYSDVDEVTGTLQTFQSLSDVECGGKEMSPTQHHRDKYGRDEAARSCDTSVQINKSFPARRSPRRRHAIVLPTRRRKISDVSDIIHSDNKDRDAQDFFNTSPSSISGDTSEVNGERTSSEDEWSHRRFKKITRRPYRCAIDSSLSSSGISDVDEPVDYRRKLGHSRRRVTNKWRRAAEERSKPLQEDSITTSCNQECRQCRRRQTRLVQQSSDTSTDLGISTSDIDNAACEPTKNTAFEVAKADSEIDETDEDKLTRELVVAKLRCQRSTLYSLMEAHHCKMCCDIDAQTSKCEFCGLALCDVCFRLHFDTHAENVRNRLESLRKLVATDSQNQTRHRLVLEIDKSMLDLIIASNIALDRALDVYRGTASVCTSFIGSLVDRRIKISNSLKYLLRQIPRVLISGDMYEMMYFIKVAKSVYERMEELQIAIGDPRSKEVFKLSLTNAFSSFGPLFEQNSLLLPLDGYDHPQGHSDVQSNTELLQKVNKNLDVSCLELKKM
ncbi:conserved hypothetical protein [Echinococcus multilocularis]|uniref:Uncharacterized protein n=1 Tax=Echinococcus multilocularis TaxID=6211 RepID=A0A068XW00_ECHMU|nr:conserved hypothetical protein [Echinococcus multilocularis]